VVTYPDFYSFQATQTHFQRFYLEQESYESKHLTLNKWGNKWGQSKNTVYFTAGTVYLGCGHIIDYCIFTLTPFID